MSCSQGMAPRCLPGFFYIVVVSLIAFHSSQAVSLTTLFSFDSNHRPDSSSGLLIASDGNFYGAAGGQLLRLAQDGSVTFFSSTCASGPLVQRAYDGSFYSASSTPPFGSVLKATTNNTCTTVATFNGTNGSSPNRLVEGRDGNFYGTTHTGGTNGGWGTVFVVTFNGRITSLHSFANGNEGAYPLSGLTQGVDGAFYGTTCAGGYNNAGTIFGITTNGVFITLYSFTGGNDGSDPVAGLLRGSDGNLYGTTIYGGTNDVTSGGDGTIFKITPSGSFTSLASFNRTNGAQPYSSLVQGNDSAFYGTTANGGALGYGTIFKMTPDGTIINLYSFGAVQNTNGAPFDGGTPTAPLTQAADGAFYGITAQYGSNSYGTIFRFSTTTLSPPAPVIHLISSAAGMLTFGWNGSPGQIFQVQYRTNLNQPDWGILISATTATNFSDAPTYSHRFYRVVTQ